MDINYYLNFSKTFLKKSKKFIAKNPALKLAIDFTLSILKIDPFYPTLNTHKANGRLAGEVFSSSINSDLRIICNFDKKGFKILDILDIGGHSGAHKVYK